METEKCDEIASEKERIIQNIEWINYCSLWTNKRKHVNHSMPILLFYESTGDLN
jgi:hypothetical protein